MAHSMTESALFTNKPCVLSLSLSLRCVVMALSSGGTLLMAVGDSEVEA